eukprot:6184233-Pleurochrysis_carterae.AAC.1
MSVPKCVVNGGNVLQGGTRNLLDSDGAQHVENNLFVPRCAGRGRKGLVANRENKATNDQSDQEGIIDDLIDEDIIDVASEASLTGEASANGTAH